MKLLFVWLLLLSAAIASDDNGGEYLSEEDVRRRVRRQDVFFPDEEPESLDVSQESCTTTQGRDGICRLLSRCPIVQDTLRTMRPTLCRFNQREPVVCCPSSERISGSTSIRVRNDVGQCGRSTRPDVIFSDTNRLVVGGRNATVATWPWMAAVGTQGRRGPEWFCGGVLISNQYVLTAAHCLINKPALVRLGDLDLSRSNDGSQPQDVPIESTVSHSQFSYPSLYHDIALIRLKEPIKPSVYIRPICLPSSILDIESQDVVLLGWGRTQFLGDTSNMLQEAELKVLKQRACASAYSDQPQLVVSLPDGIQRHQLCAGIPGGGRDACQGDSGGPLMYLNPSTQRWTVAAIVTGGLGCGFENFPGIYSRIPNYVDWIKANIRP